jgi:hypothetical protein
MAHGEELHLSEFRADLLKTLGEIYSELSLLRNAVRPARLFGEAPVEELMELIARLVAECQLNEAKATIGGRADNEHRLN